MNEEKLNDPTKNQGLSAEKKLGLLRSCTRILKELEI
jgi:hypothetical protein